MIHIPITVVGFGVAGQFLLSYLCTYSQTPPNFISVVDPDFLGGDLQRHYHSVTSNTTIQQAIDALSTLPPIWSQVSASLLEKGSPTSTLSLGILASELQTLGRTFLSKCTCYYDTVTRAQWDEKEKRWTLFLASGSAYTTDILCLCSGIVPRQEDYGIPLIPLYKALDSSALTKILRKGDKVCVIGSSHSGTLVLKNLHEIPDVQTTCIYRPPFKYARDGHRFGIKEESAKIADSIQAGEYTNLTLAPNTDLHLISKAFRTSSWLIQATGFQAYMFPCMDPSGVQYVSTWDPLTGKSLSMESVHAFGACVPNEQGDVSLGAFAEQLQTRWPPLLERLKSI